MGKRERARVAETKEENENAVDNTVKDFLINKGIFVDYSRKIGKFSAAKCIEKLSSSLKQVMENPTQENMVRLEQVMSKAGFDKALMDEFVATYSIVVETSTEQVVQEEQPLEFEMPDINSILNPKGRSETEPAPQPAKVEEPEQQVDNKDEGAKPEEEEQPLPEQPAEPAQPAEDKDANKGKNEKTGKEDEEAAKKVEGLEQPIEQPEMQLEEALEAFLKFNRVDLSKFGGKEEQAKIISELSEGVKACQQEVNPASLKMLGEVVIGKMGLEGEVVERLANIFIPNWKENARPKSDPDKDLAVIKDEAKKLNEEIEELKKLIAERKQRLEELGEKADDAEKPEKDSAEETLADKVDKATKKHDSLKTEKSFLSGIETIQKKTLDFYTDHMITGSYDGVKFILAESIALTAMAGYTIGKVTLKLGKTIGKAVFKTAKGTAQKAKEKSDAKTAEKTEEKSEQEEKDEKSDKKDKKKLAQKKGKDKPKSARQIKKEEIERQDDEEALTMVELGKNTTMELLKLSKERLDHARVDDSLIKNPSKEADLEVLRSGNDEERDTVRKMLSRENQDLVAKTIKVINNLRYKNLYSALEQECGLSKEQILDLIKTAKITDKGEIVLGKDATISAEDIELAGVGRLFRDASSIKGMASMQPEEILKFAKGIRIQDEKISVEGIENLSTDARLLAASISGTECYYNGVENAAKILTHCVDMHDLNNQMINEAYALELHQVCLDLDCQIEMIRAEMLEIQSKGVDKTKKDKKRREELALIADDKVAKLEDLGIVEVIDAESSYTAKLTKEASKVLTPDLTRDINESAELGRNYIGPEEEQEK